jgi:Protein of unknown function (DUF3891)
VLIRRDGDGALAIGQLSHAWLAGQLARAWGNADFGHVTPREEVILGAQQHDIGWARFDLAPRFNPETGLPRSFLELTVDDHLEIWRDAPELLMSQSAHAALVVSMHGSSLSELRARGTPEHAPALQSHIDEEHARQAKLCAELKVAASSKERIRRQMWTWDSISLALCNDWRPFTVTDVPTADGLTAMELVARDDGTWTLDPWPFRSARVEVQCEAKRLEQRYEDEASMRRAFEQAVPVTLEFVLMAS